MLTVLYDHAKSYRFSVAIEQIIQHINSGHKNHSSDALFQCLNCGVWSGLVKTKHIINSNTPFLLLFYRIVLLTNVWWKTWAVPKAVAHTWSPGLDISVLQLQISSLMSLPCPALAWPAPPLPRAIEDYWAALRYQSLPSIMDFTYFYCLFMIKLILIN